MRPAPIFAAIAATMALVPAAASAAPTRTGEVSAAKPFAWEGEAMASFDPGGEADMQCQLPGATCEYTLLHVPLGGALKVNVTMPATDDYDMTIYESDASGKQGKIASTGTGSVGDAEQAGVPETGLDYYLVEVAYYLSSPSDHYSAKASFEALTSFTSKIATIPASVKASKLKGFKGTAEGDPAKVQIALVKIAGSKCTSLQSSGKFTSSKSGDGGCLPTTWIDAKGTATWSFALRKRLKKGSYALFSRAVGPDDVGETEFSSANGNRANFKVK